MKAHGKWTGWLARFYYATGSIYYAYHWFLALGGLALIAGSTVAFFGIPLLAVIIFLFALASIGLGISFGRRLAKIRLASHNPGLKIQEIKIDYRLTSNREASYVREIRAKVLFPVETYENQFNWTGQGNVTGLAIEGVTSVEVLAQPGSADDICRVHFGEPLPKGKEHHFIYGLNCLNATKTVRPFLGHTVDSPVKELFMRVQLLPEQQIKNYKRQFFINSKSNLHLWEEIVPVGNPNCRELEWHVRDPQHHFYYRISW